MDVMDICEASLYLAILSFTAPFIAPMLLLFFRLPIAPSCLCFKLSSFSQGFATSALLTTWEQVSALELDHCYNIHVQPRIPAA